MIRAPPIRSSQMEFWLRKRPSCVAVAPRAKKMSVNPAMKNTAWVNATRRLLSSSSRESPVMNET
jgi:hypothetical protein